MGRHAVARSAKAKGASRSPASARPEPSSPTALPRHRIRDLALFPPDHDDRSLKELQDELESLSRKPHREKVASDQKPPRKKDRSGRKRKSEPAKAAEPSLEELQAELESHSRKPHREKVESDQKPPRKKDRSRHREKGWDRQPVLGHEPARLENPSEQQSMSIRAVQAAVAGLSEDRSLSKAATASAVYHKRAQFPADANRAQIRKQEGGDRFLEKDFGERGSYVRKLRAADMTSRKILDEANAQMFGRAKLEGGAIPNKLKAHNVANTGQTHITYGGARLYTLHRGSTAFKSMGRARDSGREVLAKKGSAKEYVRDDRGVPTGRFAYAVKGADQVARMDKGTPLRGRFLLPTHPIFGDRPRTVMSGSHTEMAAIGRQPPEGKSFGKLTPDQMLYLHQEFGSGDRQRGVSVSGSPTPLLSNEARGFADHPGAQKLRIDLSTVRPARRGGPPNLVNFHQRIRGMKDKRVVAPPLHHVEGPKIETPQIYDQAVAAGTIEPGGIEYGQARQQRRFDWSVAKNRELYLASLEKRNLRGRVAVSRLERTDIPDSPESIRAELGKAKAEARSGEAAIPKIPLRKAKGKTRKPRNGPKGRHS